MANAPYKALPALTLEYFAPALMFSAIEFTGRQVSVPLDMLPPTFNNYGPVEHPIVTTPGMCGLQGGSLRAIDGHIRSTHKLRTMSRLVACNIALAYPLQPMGPDAVLMIDFVTGPDGKPYLFYISNGDESKRDILDGMLCQPTFGSIYFDKPDDGDPKRDFVARDQQLLYLAPA